MCFSPDDLCWSAIYFSTKLKVNIGRFLISFLGLDSLIFLCNVWECLCKPHSESGNSPPWICMSTSLRKVYYCGCGRRTVCMAVQPCSSVGEIACTHTQHPLSLKSFPHHLHDSIQVGCLLLFVWTFIVLLWPLEKPQTLRGPQWIDNWDCWRKVNFTIPSIASVRETNGRIFWDICHAVQGIVRVLLTVALI